MSVFVNEDFWSEPVGFVGDYCSVCDEPSAFVLIAHRRRARVNGVRLPASIAGHEIMCTACSTPYPRKRRKHGYTAVLEEPASPEEMIARTTPDYADRHRNRMDLLRTAAAGGPLQERVQLFSDICRDLQYAWTRAPQLDGHRSSIVFFLYLGAFFSATLASILLLHATLIKATVPFALSAGFLISAVVCSRFERIRLARDIILPRLGMALRHLRPTEDEVVIVSRRCRRLRALRYLTVAEICAAVATARELDEQPAAPLAQIGTPRATAV